MASKGSGKRSTSQQQALRAYEARQAVHEHQGTRRRRDNVVAIGAIVVVATLAALAQVFYFSSGPGAPIASATPTATADEDSSATKTDAVPDAALAEGRTWTGTLTLNDIALGVELDGAAAPQAVATFVEAAETGWYVGTTCHRLVTAESAQLLQCGSVDGTGTPDADFLYGPIENPGVDGVYPAGTIAMARLSDDANSQGRQFFVVTADTVLPDDSVGGYTIVGQITSGLDELVAGIMDAGTADGSEDGSPLVPVTITGFTIQ